MHWRNIVRALAWCLAGAIVVLSLAPPDLRPETGASHGLEHFLAYAATGLFFCVGYPAKALRLAAILVVFCAVVELAQLLVPGRHARLSDFVIDAAAMVAGVIAWSLARRSVIAL